MEHCCKFADDLETCEKHPFFELAQVAPTHLCFVREFILRKPSGVPKAPQICGEYLSQIHARSEANRLKYAPRYIEQNSEAGVNVSTHAPRMELTLNSPSNSPPSTFLMTPEQHLRRAGVLERSTSPKAKELAQHHRNLAKLIQHRQDGSRPAHAEGVGPINSPARMELAYEQARQQLVRLGRQEPKGDAYPKCLFDGLVALSGAFPLFLLTGRSLEDLGAMWAVVVGVGIISYAVRHYLERAWWRDLEQRAKLIAGLLTIEELRDWEPSRKSSSHD